MYHVFYRDQDVTVNALVWAKGDLEAEEHFKKNYGVYSHHELKCGTAHWFQLEIDQITSFVKNPWLCLRNNRALLVL